MTEAFLMRDAELNLSTWLKLAGELNLVRNK